MNTQKETSINQQEFPISSKAGTFKRALYFLLVASLISLSGFGYYKYVQYSNWRTEALQAIKKVNADTTELEALQVIQSEVKIETERCKDFISQQRGEFGEFQYCQHFIEWSEKTL